MERHQRETNNRSLKSVYDNTKRQLGEAKKLVFE